MLTIEEEFRKGILFVRLRGTLNEDTVNFLKEEVTNVVKNVVIRNVVFNISELVSIDIYGINSLLEIYDICKKNQGMSLLCGVNNSLVKRRIDNSRINKYIYEVSDELTAINYINI